jgi:hypothetical protein
MSSLYDMFSAFIAMLMSAAFLHFGAAGDSHPATSIASASHSASASVSVIDRREDTPDNIQDAGQDTVKPSPTAPVHAHVRHMAAHSHCPRSTGASPTLDAVRTPSPLRRG